MDEKDSYIYNKIMSDSEVTTSIVRHLEIIENLDLNNLIRP